jgi:DNA topoisomerase-1
MKLLQHDLPTIPPATVPPQDSARAAGLRYVIDDVPGIRRIKHGPSFAYVDAQGKPLRDPEQLRRIKRLAIPPAWRDVWISPYANGHLQATGKDVRGRKQYRYHPDWRSVRDETKYSRMMAFGQALPALRRRVERDLALPGLPREKVLAAVVRLLESTLIRVGNEEYARDNNSYGLTTMLDRHAKISGETITFQFKGKSGKAHKIDVRDRRLARIVRQCQELPDQEIFAYVNEAGDWVDVKSQDVNGYIQEITGQPFTAKDFRTWYGTVLAAVALREFAECTSAKEAKGNIVRAIESVSKMLGNTPTICRKCYVHPVVLEKYLEGYTIAALLERGRRALKKELRALRPEEAAVMMLLQESLVRASARKAREPKSLSEALGRSLRDARKRPRRRSKSARNDHSKPAI